MTADTVRIDLTSAFALADTPTTTELETEGRVRYLVVNGKQDDGLWGPIGALWLSQDGFRGGFLVNPWALWEGSEVIRGYRGALERHWSPEQIYRYWQGEVWRGSYSVDEEREAGTLFLLNELVNAL
jgi:hypothetical protein